MPSPEQLAAMAAPLTKEQQAMFDSIPSRPIRGMGTFFENEVREANDKLIALLGSSKAPNTDEQIISDKELRRDLDAQLQKVKGLPPSHERSLVITKLQEAIMWLGMDLKRLNELQPAEQKAPNPYPNSYNPGNTTVDPTADNLKL